MCSALLTKKNLEGEIQGQSMFGKWNTHEYKCTDTEHDSAEDLHAALFGFFHHYRSDEAKERYEVLRSDGFQDEFKRFETHMRDYWNLETCKAFYLSVRTNGTESFFSTRMNFVPKHLFFHKHYEVKMKFCVMKWNASHISERFIEIHGDDGITERQCWIKNIHNRVFQDRVPHIWIEKRGRKKKAD